MTKKFKIYTPYLNVSEEYKPVPASSCVPDWYTEQKSYLYDKKVPAIDQLFVATIKKCIPVFDSITSGYIFFSFVDIYVQQINGIPRFVWPNFLKIDDRNEDPIQFHNNWQLDKYPNVPKNQEVPKFINPWIIKTPTGYSSIIQNPMHRDLPFQIIPGIVDTDKYLLPINFPFVLKDPNWEGMIPAKTPLAQIIPFKRDSWKIELDKFENNKKPTKKIEDLVKSIFYDSYKKNFWIKKSFK